MKFYIVDAFTEKKFGGNPAGVIILPEGADFPSDELCVKTAAELRYSETAFVKQLAEDEFQVRYFTPAAEVDLCGHATIASFKTLYLAGIIKDNTTVMNHTLAGDLNIEIKDGFVLMDMAKPVRIFEIKDEDKLEELYRVMGISYQEQKEKGLALTPQAVSTGLPDIIMPVATLEDLQAIEPDMKALSDLSDIDEEAATGTSSGATTYYGCLNGFVKSGDECKYIQGEKMGRPSVILSNIEVECSADGCEEFNPENAECYIKVGGDAVILAEGEIHI